jgi:hypothetical protein
VPPSIARAVRAWPPSTRPALCTLPAALAALAIAVAPACSGGSSTTPASTSGSDSGSTQDSATLLPVESGAPEASVEAGTGCGQDLNTTLDGQLDGTSVDQSYDSPGTGYVLLPSGGYAVEANIGTAGMMYADGTGSLGDLALQQGVLLMPVEGPDPGGIYCSGPGSTFAQTTVDTWSLQAMVRAGACPGTGTPDGDWTGCSADEEWTPEDAGPFEGAPCIAGETHIVGTRNGSAFDWQIPDVVGLGGSGSSSSVLESWWESVGDFGFIVMNASPGDAGPDTVFGALRVPASVDPTMPFYCASPSSTATVTDHAVRFTLRAVTTAGTCAAGAAGSSHVSACGPM